MVKPTETILPGGHGNIYVIIVAAGSGSRFGSNVPKQYLGLNGKPVIVHTIDAFRTSLPQAQICVVISENGKSLWEEVAREYGLKDMMTVTGGATRTESVKNALASLRDKFGDKDIVLIHDGARPLVNQEMIQTVAAGVSDETPAVIPVLPLTEAIGENTGRGVIPTDRARFCSVQTPQAFNALILTHAYDSIGNATMPDDAAVYHAFTGKPLATVPGHPQNIKITHPADIKLAEVHIANPIAYSK